MQTLEIGAVRYAGRKRALETGRAASSVLSEAGKSTATKFDIFLSHASRDAELILGTKVVLEDLGLSVYVDWVEDKDLDRSAADRSTANRLRQRMRQCEKLFYAHTANAALSKWCPWELGYFDAKSHPECKVFVLPIGDAATSFAGQEYLALYDVVDLSSLTRRRTPMRRDLDVEILGDLLRYGRPGSGTIF